MCLLLGLLLLAGCAQRTGPAYSALHGGPDLSGRLAPNLALGRSPADPLIGQLFNARSAWPAVEHGLRLSEQTYYTDVHFDDQSFYDRLGGASFNLRTSTRTGVFIR